MSDQFRLDENEVKKWLENMAIFFAPAALVFLMSVQSGKSVEESLIVLKLWGINTAIDILRKFINKKS